MCDSAAGVIIEEGGVCVRYFYLPVAPRCPRCTLSPGEAVNEAN